METGPSLACRDLVSGYGRIAIVRGVNFHARQGRLTALVGPNGCGKSTLLKTLARVIKPSTGTVELDGRPIHALPTREVARRLALLPQGPVAPEGLRVRELVAQGRFPHRTLLRQWSPADTAAVAVAMDRTNLAELAEAPVEGLSGGQRQRAWIAMALAQETPILLLDEPTTFLDLKVQVDILTLLSRIAHEEGRTVVVVLHEINMAAAFADRIVMMAGGRILAEGAPREVVTPETLDRVFGLAADVLPAPRGRYPVCIPARQFDPLQRLPTAAE
ncbi:ATP-binding cassette domain-containing protein [Rubellimicrobium sp. CFH 75288]|nr:ABC transporter ATP-binding protein [Rubellimicrobium sp. CFH 75288]NAZ38280.1 ATP-binding cassette domain-containing protein [Rubellimicrobium sp. CFH 75288]